MKIRRKAKDERRKNLRFNTTICNMRLKAFIQPQRHEVYFFVFFVVKIIFLARFIWIYLIINEKTLDA